MIYTNVGDSMEPVIREGNLLIIEAVKKPLKVGDVPLYKRDSGQYVLHRIVKIRRGEYTMKGDNRTALEKGITDRHIIGVLTGSQERQDLPCRDRAGIPRAHKRLRARAAQRDQGEARKNHQF